MYFNDFSAVSFITIVFIYYACMGLAYYKFFEKAGQPAWAGFVPIYNFYIHSQIIGRPKWWILLLLVPIVNFFVGLNMHLDLLKSFGRYTYKDQVLSVVAAPIYMNYLAWSKDTKYVGAAAQMPKTKKSTQKEWFESIVFAVFCATIIRWAFMEAYVIPTSSMESSLLVGDFLFVSKAEYGPRTPQTPLQMPLTHQTIWGTKVPSYLDWIQLPSYRLPSFGKVERNDVVVFNYPVNDQFNQRGRNSYHTEDLKTFYIKRCVAVPGDTIVIEKGQLYINSEKAQNPPDMQFIHLIETDKIISERIWKEYNISEYQKNAKGYDAHIDAETAEKLKKLNFIKDVIPQFTPKGMHPMGHPPFPNYKYYRWNADFYGPLPVPARGAKIPVNEQTLAMYGSTIKNYEEHSKVEVQLDKLIIDGKEVNEYIFKKDYFFMMGDNRHNSLDSRFWGFVPEDYIVGEASFIWMSFDSNKSFLNKIRWNRLFKGIK